MTPEQERLLREAIEKFGILYTVLLGVPNSENTGLIGTVKRDGQRISRLEKNQWLLIGVLFGTGLLAGAGAAQLLAQVIGG